MAAVTKVEGGDVMERKRVLVIGGSSGIGAACRHVLSAEGIEVLIADLREPPSTPPPDAFVAVDVRDADALTAAVATLADGHAIDGMVYAAGIGHVAPVDRITPKHWSLVLDVNLTGAFYAARAALRHMRRPSAFVFISSIDSAAPVSGLAHYCSSKAGLEALSRSLALELAPRGIRSNVVAPGPVRTPLMDEFFADPDREAAFIGQTPLGAIAKPNQIAGLVSFLLSPAADHLTGVRIPIDGGMSLREHPSMISTDERTR